MENGEYPFLRMAAFEDAKGTGLFQSFLQVADTEALPLESSGLSVAVAGIRITGLSVAGKMDGDGKWAEIYNKTLGTPTYKER